MATTTDTNLRVTCRDRDNHVYVSSSNGGVQFQESITLFFGPSDVLNDLRAHSDDLLSDRVCQLEINEARGTLDLTSRKEFEPTLRHPLGLLPETINADYRESVRSANARMSSWPVKSRSQPR